MHGMILLVMIFMSIFSIVLGSNFATLTDSVYVDNSSIINGSSSTYEIVETSVSFTIDTSGLAGAIGILTITIIAIAIIFGVQIVSSGVSASVDIYKILPWNRSATRFYVTGTRIIWTPDAPNWDLEVDVIKVLNNGSEVTIDEIRLYSTDAVLRADDNEPGSYETTNYNTQIDGINGQGLIVYVNQAGMGNIYLEVKYVDTFNE